MRFSGRLDPVVRLGVLLRWFHVVREVREWPAARKSRGRRCSPEAGPGGIPERAGFGVASRELGGFRATMRS